MARRTGCGKLPIDAWRLFQTKTRAMVTFFAGPQLIKLTVRVRVEVEYVTCSKAILSCTALELSVIDLAYSRLAIVPQEFAQ